MRYPRVKHSFAGRLTAWITITLLVVMLLITGVVSFLVKRGMTVEAEKRYLSEGGIRLYRLHAAVFIRVIRHCFERYCHFVIFQSLCRNKFEKKRGKECGETINKCTFAPV